MDLTSGATQHRLNLDEWVASARYLSVDGRQIAYWTAGSGRPLLLVHGYPTASWDWHRIWPTLSQHRRLVACDMLGFGLSDKPPIRYAIQHQARIQEALLAELAIESYDALVHDYGVSVGQELLARQLEGSSQAQIGRMAFLNGGLFAEQHRPVALQKLGISPIGFVLGWIINRQRFGRSFSAVFGADSRPTDDELDEHWRLITHNNGHRVTHRLLSYIAERVQHRERWVSALQAGVVPVQLINGGADPVSGKHLYEYFRQQVPGADAVCFEEIGHYPQLEAPERVLTELGPFLAQRGI
ncbi:MAG: alpha/beta fold hydrolase [Pseudomonadota bacterium]